LWQRPGRRSISIASCKAEEAPRNDVIRNIFKKCDDSGHCYNHRIFQRDDLLQLCTKRRSPITHRGCIQAGTQRSGLSRDWQT
jgi:CRISPR/Cas system CSM-associated protein Csm3 (group 7 of RAMP superfamily)